MKNEETITLERKRSTERNENEKGTFLSARMTISTFFFKERNKTKKLENKIPNN